MLQNIHTHTKYHIVNIHGDEKMLLHEGPTEADRISYGRKLTTENKEKANRQAGICQYNT
jgi:hypothetical protein